MTEPDRRTPFRAGRAMGESFRPEAAMVMPPDFGASVVLLADVSEFQPDIADSTYLNDFSKAIIIRAAYGTSHEDHAWYGGARRADLLSGGAQFLGIYQYIVASQDPAAQAKELVSILGGKLNKGELVIADIEEGGGNQNQRWLTWAGVIAAELGDDPWNYSGQNFASTTGLAPVDWVAAYSSTEPSVAHTLWQFTDSYSIPGIGTSDCSVFHGTIDQLAAYAHGGSQPQTDWTEQMIMALPTIQQGAADAPGQIMYVHRAQALAKVIGQINSVTAAASLTTDGNFGPATTAGIKAIQQLFGLTQDGVVGPNTWHKLVVGT